MRTLKPLAVLLLLCCLVAAGCGVRGAGDSASGGALAGEEPVAARVQLSPVAATGPVRLVAVGDIACPPGAKVTSVTCQQAATARLARSLNPTRVVPLGDLQYETGSYDAFLKSYHLSWGTMKAITKPVVGNHEYRTAGAAGFYRYFGTRGPGYYAWNAGSWRIYNLNSNCTQVNCARQTAWLEADLKANPRRCSIIAMHAPRFSSGLEHGNSLVVKPFWQVAYKYRVDVALAGHDHDYERFVRKNAAGDYRPNRGIQSFVSGTGGKSLYPMGTRKAGSAFFDGRHFGVLLLKLGTGSYSWEYRTIDGKVRDSGSRTCL